MNGNRCEYLFSNNIYHFIIILHEKWFHSQCYRQWLYRAPLCITIKIWVVAYLEFIICFPSTFFLLSYFMQLFIADATIFFTNFKFFWPWKHRKMPSKVVYYRPKLFFSVVPTGPNRRIHVPKCGLLTNCIQNFTHVE